MFGTYYDYIAGLDIAGLKSSVIGYGSDLKSTKIMTRLRHPINMTGYDADNYCDVLYVNIYDKKYGIGDRLIILHDIPSNLVAGLGEDTFDKENIMTFTEFKSAGMGKWFVKCDKEPAKELILSNGRKINVWRKPVILHAVTDYDKDFRKIWRNGELIYEGNNYGDYSTFYIIGSFVE